MRRAPGYTIRGGPGSIAPVPEEMYAQSGITTIFDKQGHATVGDPPPTGIPAPDRLELVETEDIPADIVVIRPDGYVCRAGPSDDSLGTALKIWFG